MDASWNVGAADDIERMLHDNEQQLLRTANLLHFNGDNKPWLSTNKQMRQLFDQYAPKNEPKR
jgi:hypothetical protein